MAEVTQIPMSLDRQRIERERMIRAEKEYGSTPSFRNIIREIGSCTDPEDRMRLGELLATHAFSAGWRSK